MKHTDGGQLYTIEGFAAALIMIITAFLVVNATSIYTAGDTHISDMQLEALGTDALKMMDVAPNSKISTNFGTPLQQIIEANPVDSTMFNTTFSEIINQGTFQNPNTIHYNATYTCRNINSDNSLTSNSITQNRNLTGGEHTVRATKWVIIKDTNGNVCDRDTYQAVLVEVLLWRD
jgi:hypothetical protein